MTMTGLWKPSFHNDTSTSQVLSCSITLRPLADGIGKCCITFGLNAFFMIINKFVKFVQHYVFYVYAYVELGIAPIKDNYLMFTWLCCNYRCGLWLRQTMSTDIRQYCMYSIWNHIVRLSYIIRLLDHPRGVGTYE